MTFHAQRSARLDTCAKRIFANLLGRCQRVQAGASKKLRLNMRGKYALWMLRAKSVQLE